MENPTHCESSVLVMTLSAAKLGWLRWRALSSNLPGDVVAVDGECVCIFSVCLRWFV